MHNLAVLSYAVTHAAHHSRDIQDYSTNRSTTCFGLIRCALNFLSVIAVATGPPVGLSLVRTEAWCYQLVVRRKRAEVLFIWLQVFASHAAGIVSGQTDPGKCVYSVERGIGRATTKEPTLSCT